MVKVDPDKIKVKQWSFCPRCKGQSLKSCPQCGGKGTVVEEVLLSEIRKPVRQEYMKAQQDFLREQLGLKGGEAVTV